MKFLTHTVDFSNTSPLPDNLFDEIAKDFLNNYELTINDARYRLVEIEFYLNNRSHKLDCFTHEYEVDNQYDASKFKTGQLRPHRSGIDIVLANKSYYGGILLRGIQRINASEKPVDGPINVSDEIIRNFSFDTANTLKFERKEDLTPVEYFKSSRVGLKFKKEKEKEKEKDREKKKQLKYLHKRWRYIAKPISTQKEKSSIRFNLIKDKNGNLEEIKETLHTEKQTFEDYKKWIIEGENLSEKEAIDIFTKPRLPISQQAKLFGYCRNTYK